MKFRTAFGYAAIGALIVGAIAPTGCSKPTAQTTTPAATPAPTTSNASNKVGQSVAAKWTDDNLWLAKVTAVDGDKVTVQFADDQSKLTVAAADVRPIEETTWPVGSDVLAVWSSGRFYPGQITAADGTTYTVKWADGSTPSQVTSDKIIAVP